MKRIILSLLLLLSVYGFATAQQAEGYPRAEWDKATAILMHTPGQEFF